MNTLQENLKTRMQRVSVNNLIKIMRCEEYDLCSYFKRVARKISQGQ